MMTDVSSWAMQYENDTVLFNNIISISKSKKKLLDLQRKIWEMCGH